MRTGAQGHKTLTQTHTHSEMHILTLFHLIIADQRTDGRLESLGLGIIREKKEKGKKEENMKARKKKERTKERKKNRKTEKQKKERKK